MIRKVSTDVEAFRFNTMLAAMMEFTNALAKERQAAAVDGEAWSEAMEALVLCLAPSAPHVTEEIWERLGQTYSVHTQAWPSWDPALTEDETVTLIVQVNGKVRERIEVEPGLDEESARERAEASEKIAGYLAGKPGAPGDLRAGQAAQPGGELATSVAASSRTAMWRRPRGWLDRACRRRSVLRRG